ncbi:uncharacterized protein [Panulirus ornatus]|uniref:uncharacterized protein n=1 Tax=Panulirus ornatus TaxID=150431 RepID=UPI003A86B381
MVAMKRYTWLWAAACLSLSLSLTLGLPSMKAAVVASVECQSLQSSQSPFNVMTVTTVASEIRCAIRSGHRGAVQYMFNDQDGTCVSFGDGVTHDSRSASFVTLSGLNAVQVISIGKQTYGSPHHGTLSPDLAIDDNDADESSYRSAIGELYPWWLLDLNQTCVINEVHILPRRNCCAHSFHDVEVRVGNSLRTDGYFSSYKLFATYEGPYKVAEDRLVCLRMDGVTGRYVTIQRVTPENYNLQFADVRVIGMTL